MEPKIYFREINEFTPKKLIKVPNDIPTFTNGKTCAQFVQFIEAIQESVRGKNYSMNLKKGKFQIFEEHFEALEK